MKRIALLAVAALFFPSVQLSAKSLGQITYLQGPVAVVRDRQSHSADVVFGFPIEGFDEITTGSGGIAQISLDFSGTLNARLTMQPGTSLYVETHPTGRSVVGAIELLSGSIGMDVHTLSDSTHLYVRTSGAVLAVRRAKFQVTTMVSGDMLVSVGEGVVECQSAHGGTLYAGPHRAVEQTVDGQFRNLPVDPLALNAFREEWRKQRLTAFQSDATRDASLYVRRFDALQTRFDAAYRELMQHRAIFDKWLQNDISRGPARKSPTSDADKVRTSLLHARSVQYEFERVFAQLVRLRDYYETIARWPDSPSVTFHTFFLNFDNSAGQTVHRFRTIRSVSKMYVHQGGRLRLDTYPQTNAR